MNFKKIFSYIVRFLYLILFLISFTLLIDKINNLFIKNDLYIKYILISFFIFYIISIINIIKKKRNFLKYISFIFLFIFICINTLTFANISYVEKMINKANDKSNIEYKKYKVIVLNESKYNYYKDLKKTKIGFINENNYNNSKKTLKERTNITFKSKKYNDLISLIGGLNNDEINAIVIDDNYLSMLKENKSKALNNTKIIYGYKSVITKKEKKIKKDNNEKSNTFIMYISGSDSRDSINTVSRSDVNIVAVVNPNDNKILLVNIPRDYYVQLHGTSGVKDKLTHAGVYGIDMSIKTIEDLLNIDIDNYLKVGFNTVIKSVDLVGGIEINSDSEFVSSINNNCSFKKGINEVNGDCALAFARERYAYLEGDRHRGLNQEEVIRGFIDKISSPKYLLKYNKILKEIDDTFETNMDYNDIVSLVKEEATSLASWTIESYNLDGENASMPTYSMGSQRLYVMIPYESTIKEAKEKIKENLNNDEEKEQ